MENSSPKGMRFKEINLSLTEEMVEEFREIFNTNKNHTGRLKLDKLIEILQDFDLPLSDNESKQYQNKLALDDGAYIHFPQFTHLIARKIIETEVEEEIKQLFRMFDTKNIGYITAVEMKNVLVTLNPRITDEDIEGIVREGDLDEDGVLNYQQFVYMCLPR